MDSRSLTPELDSMLPRTNWSRRGFVMTSLATGFALSVGKASAKAIITDTNGLTAGEVKVPTADGEMPAYRAMPDGGGPFATVLVVQEVFGVHEHIKDICRRLAKAGYFAIAPELCARQGDPSKYTGNFFRSAPSNGGNGGGRDARNTRSAAARRARKTPCRRRQKQRRSRDPQHHPRP